MKTTKLLGLFMIGGAAILAFPTRKKIDLSKVSYFFGDGVTPNAQLIAGELIYKLEVQAELLNENDFDIEVDITGELFHGSSSIAILENDFIEVIPANSSSFILATAIVDIAVLDAIAIAENIPFEQIKFNFDGKFIFDENEISFSLTDIPFNK